MGDEVGGRESVGERIDLLEARYGDFAINQTTVTVPADSYRQARDRTIEGIVDAYVRVWNDDGEAIHLRCEPSFRIDHGGRPLEARVRTAVRESAGVDATLEDVARVTIAGIRNEDDGGAPAVYRLLVLFDANYASGTPENVEWNADTEIVPEFVGGA